MEETQETTWKWSWNKWFGIVYGPIPVGIIVVGTGFLVYTVVTS